MARFILRFRGPGPPSEDDLRRIRSAAGVTVIDDTSRRMVLVDGAADEVKKLREKLPGWLFAEERQVPLPDVRMKTKKPGPEEPGK